MGKRSAVVAHTKVDIAARSPAMPETRTFTENELREFDVTNPDEGKEFNKRAEILLGETPAKRAQSLKEFRKKLEMIEDFEPKTDDDRFLLRFLRARKFDVDKAYKLMRNFYKVRLQNPQRYVPIGLGPRDFKHLYELNCAVLLRHRNPLDGTVIVLCRFGKWKPSTGFGPLDVYTPAVYGGELIMDQPEVQLNGFTFILDLQGLEYNWILKYVTPDYITVSRAGRREWYMHAHGVGEFIMIVYSIITNCRRLSCSLR